MNVIYRLRTSSNKSKSGTIWADFSHAGTRLRISTQLRIPAGQWSVKKMTVLQSHEDSFQINDRLRQVTDIISKLIGEVQRQEILVTEKEFKLELNDRLFNIKAKARADYDLLTFIDMQIGKNPKGLKEATLKQYRQLKRCVTEFSKSQNFGVRFKDINVEWFLNFKTFLRTKNYSPAQNDKHVKNTKAMMRSALNLNYHSNRAFEAVKRERQKSRGTTEVYLNDTEVLKLNKLDLEGRDAIVRDVFVFACYTGLRFSDWASVQYNGVDDYITIMTKKGEQIVKIPLTKTSKAILAKYHNKLPHITSGLVNTRIKKICLRIPTLRKQIDVFITKGETIEKKLIPRYNLVASHTCRRTFATNEFKRGTPVHFIRKVTGHATEQEFWNYIKVSDEEILKAHLALIKKRGE